MTIARVGTTGTVPPAPREPRRGRVALTLWLVLVLAGVALLGWVGWQVWGTNWVSKRHQAEAVEQLREEWGSVSTRDGAGSDGTRAVDVAGGTATGIVRIPRFGDDYAVPLLEGVGDDALATGFGHFTDSAAPGEPGNFAVAAHRVTHGEPLRDMPSLQPGDEVVVETRDRVYTYVLTTGGDDLVVPFTETWVVDPLPRNPAGGGVQPDQTPGQRLITLTTCSELFHTDDRMIAFGVLSSDEPRG